MGHRGQLASRDAGHGGSYGGGGGSYKSSTLCYGLTKPMWDLAKLPKLEYMGHSGVVSKC